MSKEEILDEIEASFLSIEKKLELLIDMLETKKKVEQALKVIEMTGTPGSDRSGLK